MGRQSAEGRAELPANRERRRASGGGLSAIRDPGRLELESLAKSSSPASTDIMSAGVGGGTGVSD
jgi:hypothetical protein